MRTKQHTLLAGVAALALFVGSGLAYAQGISKDQSNTETSKGTKNSAASTQTMKPAQAGAPNLHAQSEGKQGGNADAQSASKESRETKGPSTAQTKGPATAQKGSEHQGANPSAQNAGRDMDRGGKNANNQNQAAKDIDQGQKGHNNRAQLSEQHQQRGHFTAQQEQSRRNHRSVAEQRDRSSTAKTAEQMQRNGSLKGLQANASASMSGNVKLTEQQRTRVREEVIDARSAPRVDHVDFDIRVGTLVPRTKIHVVPVPETLVRIEPRWHGYLYFVYEDQVIVVNPRDMRIVAVLDV